MNRVKNSKYANAFALSILACLASPAWAETTSEARLRALEQRLDNLESENRVLKDQLKQTEQKVEATGTQMDRMSGQGSSADKTKLGGYGELHLNKLQSQTGGADTDMLDLHRFVLFIGHEFNDSVRMFSELEVEHALAGESKPGEVELEQAYLEFDLNDNLSAKGGLFLLPVGILNETHEPPTFYGVERNPVETNIIPSTWWEGGAAMTARFDGGITLDGAWTTGLKATAANGYKPRNGRQKVANATAKDAAYTARLKWSGVPGVEVAGTVHHQSDMTQSVDATAGAATLYETHAVVNKGAFGLRALYAQWKLDGSGPKAIGADKQVGWYVEPSWKFAEQWGVFARQSSWDNAAGNTADSKFSQADVGVNFWPHPDVVVKLDYQNQKVPVGQNELDGFNLGLGYQF
ncbi:MAG: porin [Gallionellaceae bacterium]|nr:porin [Gallionellaceae bacterium]